MRYAIGWTAVLGLAFSATACAYGVVEDDDDDGTSGTALYGGTSTGSGMTSDWPGGSGNPSFGSCYVDAGECNPMQLDCSAGEACDATAEQGFVCFPPPNAAQAGDACTTTLGPYCETGTTCVDGVCRAYCCTAGDCMSGTCASVGTAAGITLRACLP